MLIEVFEQTPYSGPRWQWPAAKNTHFPGETYRNHTSFSEPEIQQTYAGQESASDLSRMHLRQLVETTLVQV